MTNRGSHRHARVAWGGAGLTEEVGRKRRRQKVLQCIARSWGSRRRRRRKVYSWISKNSDSSSSNSSSSTIEPRSQYMQIRSGPIPSCTSDGRRKKAGTMKETRTLGRRIEMCFRFLFS